jgi:hypothetical protein
MLKVHAFNHKKQQNNNKQTNSKICDMIDFNQINENHETCSTHLKVAEVGDIQSQKMCVTCMAQVKA